MEAERVNRVQRSLRNMQPPPEDPTPVKVPQTISVAAMFNRQQNEKAQATKDQQLTSKVLKSAAKVPPKGLAKLSKIRSSSQTPDRVGKGPKKRSEMHPLAVAFKNTSDDYRRYLYKSATLKISHALETLISNLHEQTLQPVSSDIGDGADSPIRLSRPAKFEREADKIYQPISAYKIGLTRTSTDGERTKIVKTLEDRMSDYIDYIEKNKAEIANLENEWEATVGEIWKVGVQCLGEDAMELMLFAKKQAEELQTLPTRAENELFATEQATSPPQRTAPSKKRVTFDTPNYENEPSLPERQPLHFLYQASRSRLAPVADMPVLPNEEIGALETQIEELGRAHLDDLKQAEKDYKLFWQKKNRMLAQVFVED